MIHFLSPFDQLYIICLDASEMITFCNQGDGPPNVSLEATFMASFDPIAIRIKKDIDI